MKKVMGLPQIYPPKEESVGQSASIYHGVDTEAHASPKRFAGQARRRLVPMLQSERDCLESDFAKSKA